MQKPLISVIVCTYNRLDVLPGCLQSLAGQTTDKSLYEVIIVNNNSTDSTQSLAEEFAGKYLNFRVVVETSQGLSYSRNRGWQEAKGEYVAYIDDDARAYPDWIEQMGAFIKRHPEIKAFGGPYEAFSLVDIPNWFPPGYGSYMLGDRERAINIGSEWINGTNMIFKKVVLASFNGFNKDLGMKGNEISYGEETRLLLDLKKDGIQVYYVPDMKVKHLISANKLSLRWLLLSSYADGLSSSKTFNKRRSLLSHIYGITKSIAKMLRNILLPRSIPLKRRLYYALSPLFIDAGAFVDFIRTGPYKQ